MKSRLELIAHAQKYLSDLSLGIHPITHFPISPDSDLNNDRLKRCFAFAADVLSEVYQNGNTDHDPDKTSFFISEEAMQEIVISETSVTASALARQINQVIDTGKMQKITAKQIADAMAALGYLRNQKTGNKQARVVTQSGIIAGIG